MTSADGGVAAPPPRGRTLLVVLLAFSVVLNVCFIAGVAWTRWHGPSRGADRMEEMAAALKLSPEQKTAFEQFSRVMRARSQLMRAELDPIIAEAWTEIAKPQPDAGKIEHDFESAALKRRSFARDATQNTLAFLDTLSPEQRTKFVALLREHRAFWLQK